MDEARTALRAALSRLPASGPRGAKKVLHVGFEGTSLAEAPVAQGGVALDELRRLGQLRAVEP
jgi:hypothetical protein